MARVERPESAEQAFLLELLDNNVEREIVTLIGAELDPGEVLKRILLRKSHD